MYSSNHLAHHLRAATAQNSDATFVKHGDGCTSSFGDFFANAEAAAATLMSLGVNPSDRVAAQVDKSVAALELYVGCVLAGAVFLPLNTAYTPSEVSYFLGDGKPTVFLSDPEKHADLSPVTASSGVPNHLTLDINGQGTWADIIQASVDFEPIARNADDLAAILYTSGTTGRSKGAMLSHANLASNSLVLRETWHFTSADTLIHALPIFHTHGLFVATNIALMSGASIAFLPSFDTDKIIDLMATSTALMGVPTCYTRLLKHPDLAAASKNMRLFISGSAPLLAETHVAWNAATGHAILERYGMTETNMNTSNPYGGDRRPGTVGLPLTGVDVKITDPDTHATLPMGGIGILQVRGPNVFQGYWKMPEKTAEELLPDGFFITGDIAKQDADGYVTIVGRGKDLIISGGFNIYPKEIEDLLDQTPGVLETAVIAAPHPDLGEAAIAVVVPTVDNLTKATVMAQATALARFKQPRAVMIVSELPRNTMGKVQKNVLRDTYAATFSD